MPVPPDPSHSTSDPENVRRPGGGDHRSGDERRTGDGLSGAAAAGADRFWQEFSRARTERPRRGREGAESDAPKQPAEEKSSDHECLDWCPICRSADVLRAAGGPEVRNQIASLQRDSLLALRTLIDAYLARSGPSAPPMWTEAPPRPADPPPLAGEHPPGPGPRRTAQPAEPPVQDIPRE